MVIELAGSELPAEQVGIRADDDATMLGIVGHDRTTIAASKLLVEGALAPVIAAVRQIIQLACTGFCFQANAGVMPWEYLCLKAGQFVV
ncbi:MAG: hypothetical protein KatS3mg109_1685 [Pirellulaceae bacterium]|nr:MAG: hypothetical protein KatS3mg109_1685 [Pirellulaceae bacterium]